MVTNERYTHTITNRLLLKTGKISLNLAKAKKIKVTVHCTVRKAPQHRPACLNQSSVGRAPVISAHSPITQHLRPSLLLALFDTLISSNFIYTEADVLSYK